MTATASAEKGRDFGAEVVALPLPWRVAAAALKVFARGSLLAMVAALLFSDEPPTNPLAQMRMFAGLFLAPEAAAWCVARAFAARLTVRNGLIVLEQRAQRAEIRIQALASVEPWTLPLPANGLSLRLDSGALFGDGIVMADPASFVAALTAQGGKRSLGDALEGRAILYTKARLANPRGIFENPLLKFVLFPLVPALPAFGEYQTFGLKAYLLALAIWWISWAIGLVLFAAVLRMFIEAGTILAVFLQPAWAAVTRRILEIVGRVLYYLGIPAWLLIRLWPW